MFPFSFYSSETPPPTASHPNGKNDASSGDSNIQHEIDRRHEKEQTVLKLLLLGPGESGKSTLFKQIQTIYGDGFSQTDLIGFLHQVQNNTMLCLKALADNVLEYGDVEPDNEEIVDILQNYEKIDDSSIPPEHVEAFKRFWQDPATQKAWRHRSEYQIYGCAEYLLNKLDEISAPSYTPTVNDLLQIRVRTTGIVETIFDIQGQFIKLVDVGGQRNERRKWIHCFQNVSAVIFVAAISEYDQRLFEDETINRLDEALVLFQEVCTTHYFTNIPILLFLNKRDLFERKILQIPLAEHHPLYNGPANDPIAASDWIAEQFRRRNSAQKNKIVYCHVTCATDTNVVRDLFVTVKDIVVREALSSVPVA